MNADRWRIIESIYQSASTLRIADRISFVARACRSDEDLLHEVSSLLEQEEASNNLFDEPAIALIAKTMAREQPREAKAMLGKTISHYRISEIIGRGGMGIVYQAEDLKLGRQVALKLIPDFLGVDARMLERFEREAQAASALNHPSICTVYEIDEAEGLQFIVIELLNGETLKDRIARGPLSELEIVTFAAKIAGALETAHRAGIIHRDVKPSNIFLVNDGNAKLLDFGIAKRLGSAVVVEAASPTPNISSEDLTRGLTTPGALVGTVAYMSPEQTRGEELDERSDLFSLGAVLYESVTQLAPFSGKDVAAVIGGIRSGTPHPVRKVRPETSSELARIVTKAIEKDRSRRYRSAGELRSDLQKLGLQLENRPRRRRAGMAAGILCLAVTGVAAMSIRIPSVRNWIDGSGRSITRDIKAIAVMPLQNLTGDPSQEYFVDGISDALITNLTEVGSLHVISRTSSMKYKNTKKSLAEIGSELHADVVLEGSVVRSMARIRVTAQLIDALNDRTIWARDYDRDVQDVIQVENELAGAVALEVIGTLTPKEQARFAHGRSVKPDVYDAYLKGRYFLNRPVEADLKKAVGYFEQALRLDPDYAPAYSGLADAYSYIGFVGDESDKPRTLAVQAAKKAISLDDSLGEAHASLGWILHRHLQKWSAAETEYKRAIELNPSYATAHRYYGVFFRDVGLDGAACGEFRLAHELDPLNSINTDFWAKCVYLTGNVDEAVRIMNDILEIDPRNLDSLWTLGEMYEKRRMFPQAIEQYQKGIEVTGGKAFIPYSLLASAYAGNGQTNNAEEILKVMNKKFGEDKWISASVHAQMGQKELAISELAEDEANCGPGTCGPAASLYISNWRFGPLRSDPRFQAILRKFDYPESAFRESKSPL